MSEIEQEFVVPMEATERGSLIIGELKSEGAAFPSMLAQFSKVHPSSRKAKIYLYPTLEQTKRLFAMRPPLTFRGEYDSTAYVHEVWTAEGIWLKSGSEIRGKNRRFWSSPAGDIESLVISSESSTNLFMSATSSAWFTVDRCFLFQILANPDEEDIEQAKHFGFEREKFFLEVSDGATAEIQHYNRAQRIGVLKDLKKKGYSILVRNYKDVDTVRKDSEAVMILASLGSREQTMFGHWNSSPGTGHMTRRWRFNLKKFPQRDSRTDPLLPRDRAACSRFLQTAFPIYRSALHTELFDGAVYALMARELVLEMRIARLFSGIQGAMVFALQEPRRKKRPRVRSLYEKFLAKYGSHFDDLWPLLHDTQGGPSLYDIRSAVVHGETFTENDFLALSYASQNLEWMLERILLLSLRWKIEESYVSLRTLQHFYAHQWRGAQQSFKI